MLIKQKSLQQKSLQQKSLQQKIQQSRAHSNSKFCSALKHTGAPGNYLRELLASQEVCTDDIHSMQPVIIPSGRYRPSQQYAFWSVGNQHRSTLLFFGTTLWPANGEVKARLVGTPSSVVGWESGFGRSSSNSHPSTPKSKVSSGLANSSVLVSTESPQKSSVYAWVRTEKRRARI